MEKISIIIPAYKEENYIGKTLEQLAEIKANINGHYQVEVIVVVNGEPDDTESIARKYADKIIKSEKGPSIARNMGATFAEGDIYVFLDADTQVSGDILDKVVRYASEGFVGTCRALPERMSPKAKLLIWLKNFILKLGIHKGSNGIIFCSRDLFQKAGQFNEKLQVGEIHDFFKRVLKYGRYCFLEECYVIPSLRRYEKNGYLNTIQFWLKWIIAYISKHQNGIQKKYPWVR